MKVFISVMLMIGIAIGCKAKNNQNISSMNKDDELKKVTVLDSIGVAYREAGEGSETLFFVHGLGSNHKAFSKMVGYFQSDYRCISIDLPGYGDSSKGDYPFSMSFFSNVIEEVVKELGLENITLVGHSMGGQISLKTALRDKAAIARLVLLAPAGIETFTEKESAFLKQVSTPSFFKSLGEDQVVANFKANFSVFPEDANFMIEDRMMLKANEAAYDYYCNMIPICITGMLDEPVFDSLGEISLPVLLLFGEEDQLIPNKYLHPELTTDQVAKSGKRALKNVELSMIDSGGHFFFWEKSVKSYDAIESFLSK